MKKNMSKESRLGKLVRDVFCRSLESVYVEPVLNGEDVIVPMATLQLLDKISAPSVFLEAMGKLDVALNNDEREPIKEITLKDIIKFKATCPKIFEILTLTLMEDRDVDIEIFAIQLLIATVLWTMSELDESVESFIIECENHIQYVEDDDGNVDVVFLNNKDEENAR